MSCPRRWVNFNFSSQVEGDHDATVLTLFTSSFWEGLASHKNSFTKIDMWPGQYNPIFMVQPTYLDLFSKLHCSTKLETGGLVVRSA